VCGSTDQQSWVGLPEAGLIAELVAVDVPTGAALRSLAIDGEVLMQDTVGEDLLVTFLDAEGAIGVIRWDPRAGEVWSYRSAPGVLPEIGAFYTSEVWVQGLWDGVLRLTEELALDVGTGRGCRPQRSRGRHPSSTGTSECCRTARERSGPGGTRARAFGQRAAGC
jgi:hypothetical protein